MNKEFIESIIFIMIGIIIITLMCILIVSFVEPSSMFESKCESLGGDYWETVNVTCAALKPNCRENCRLHGTDYNYYEDDFDYSGDGEDGE
jgi:hypothetical protein